MAKDLICGMEVKNDKIKSVYEGKTYYFCSQVCKTDFEKNPKQYA